MTCLEVLFDNFHGPKIASAPANGVFEKHLDIFHDSFKIYLKNSSCPVSKSTEIFPWLVQNLLDNILCPVQKLPPAFSMTCSKTSPVPCNGLSKTSMIDLHGLKVASAPSDGLFGSHLGTF